MANKPKKHRNQFSGLSGIGRRAYDTKAGRKVSAGVGSAALIGGLVYAARSTGLGRSLIASLNRSFHRIRASKSDEAVVSYAGGDEAEDSFV